MNTANAEQGSNFLLMGMNKIEFNAKENILSNPNVFIGDTGSSSNTTALDLKFKNIEPSKTSNNIVDASGNDLVG